MVKISASDIVRELFGKIAFGDKIIDLTLELHKAILVSLMNLATSTAGNSDAEKSAETILAFLSDIKVSDLGDYTITVGDGVKTAVFNGKVLRDLALTWGMVKVTWHVSRGGKRQAQASESLPVMSSLFSDNPDAS